MPKWLSTLLMLVLVLGIAPFLVLTSVHAFLLPNWIAFEYSRPDFPKADLFNDKDRLFNATESLLYTTGDRTLEQFKALSANYNEREIKHMTDVRVIISQERVFYWIDVALLLIAIVVLGRNKETRALAAGGLLRGALVTLGLFVIVAVAAAISFNTFFTTFHRIFFSGDTWLFLYTDSLIQFYPLPFWIDTTFAIVALATAGAIIVGALGWVWGRNLRMRAGD